MINLTTKCRKSDTVLLKLAAAFVVLLTSPCSAQERLEPPTTSPTQQPQADDAQVLMRGPLHEAFASTYQANPEPNGIVDGTPPDQINELPPEFKPEGDNIQWIPGYWAWDEIQTEFIWISGVWRDVPPNQNWISGYWEQAENGHRWVSGFWTTEAEDRLTYVPAPPANQDRGPTVISPGDNYFYCPGNWEYRSNAFVWRAGYWRPRIDNRIWIPSCYAWTPRGCVYRTGYWDYEFDNRGVVFAPVLFPRPLYQDIGFVYRPAYSVDTGADFFVHLFVRPNCSHYFFGDWYGGHLGGVHYRPWVDHASHLRHYDPLLVHYGGRRHRHQGAPLLGWVHEQHRFYANHHDTRPRGSLNAHRKFQQSHRDHQHRDHLRRAELVKQSVDRGRRSKPDHGSARPISDRDRIAATLARKQREEVQRARRNRERVTKSQRTTEQIRLAAQQKQTQRNRDAFMRSQQRKKQQTLAKSNPTGKAKVPGVKGGGSTRRRPADNQTPGAKERGPRPDVRKEDPSRRAQQRASLELAKTKRDAQQQQTERRRQQEKATRAESDRARRAQQQANLARQKAKRDTQQQQTERRRQQEKATRAESDQARRAQQQANLARQNAKRDAQQQQTERRRQQERATRAESDRARRAEQQANLAREKSQRQARDRARDQKRQSDQARHAQEAQQRRAAEQQRQQQRRRDQEARKAKRKKKKT